MHFFSNDQIKRTGLEVDSGIIEDIGTNQTCEDSALLAAAVSSSADAVIITGMSGNILYVNGAFEKMTGYFKNEVLGADMKKLAKKTGADGNFEDAFNETVRTGAPWSGTTTSARKDGTIYTAEQTLAPVKNRAGEVVNVIIFKKDITERLRLESIAESVNMMDNIGYIFSGIRHEIGNPVSSVKMALSVLRSKLDYECTREVIERYLDRAMEELSRMEYLLRTLKSFSMYESPDLKDMDMGVFTGNLKGLLENDFRKKGIKLGILVQPGAECGFADPRALQQVMLNILTNAVDSLDGRPSPWIDIKIMRIGSRILIHIEDNGCGMSPGQMKDAFRPFYSTKPKGSGLGLMLAQKMVSKMNGTMEISSQQDLGTSVDIFIPGGKNEQ